LAIPRKQWPRELALGLAIAALLAILQHAPLSSTRRVLLGVSHSILGLFFGISGLVLYFMTFFSNHDYTYNNINIAFISPLLFVAIPLGIQLARGKHAGRRFPPQRLLHILWTIVFFGGVFTMLVKLSPAFYQQNQVTQALVLPFAFVLSYVPECLREIWGHHFPLAPPPPK
jgi:cytochrome bd-type quinol oxidase subunit 2